VSTDSAIAVIFAKPMSFDQIGHQAPTSELRLRSAALACQRADRPRFGRRHMHPGETGASEIADNIPLMIGGTAGQGWR
jgi:hypothetical protein